jgi:HAD superfamily hydrolase (TIGR01549 family)
MSEIRGITLDFYQTLVRHRTGQGRGAALMEYLADEGLPADPWEHQVLYDVFDFYGRTFRSGLTAAEEQKFWRRFAERLFRRLNVGGAEPVSAAEHAEAVRQLLGPSSLALYEDVLPALEWLQGSGLRKGIVSNWQRGLSHFLRELGVLDYFDFVVVSAEVGYQKPDTRMFQIASERMGLEPGEILHVGDNPVQDVAAATESGFHALHLVRDDSTEVPAPPVIASLAELQARWPLGMGEEAVL